MLILGIDTSAKIGSIALSDGERAVAELSLVIDSRCSERLIPNIDFILRESGYSKRDIELLAFSAGPGSYTGLRIGLSTMKAIAYAADIPMVAISSLMVLAGRFSLCDMPVVPVVDAHTALVYSAVYRRDQEIIAPEARTLDRFLHTLDEERYLFTGIDSYKFIDRIKDIMKERAIFAPRLHCLPSALTLIDLALKKADEKDFVDIDNYSPEYLRDFSPKIKKQND